MLYATIVKLPTTKSLTVSNIVTKMTLNDVISKTLLK